MPTGVAAPRLVAGTMATIDFFAVLIAILRMFYCVARVGWPALSLLENSWMKIRLKSDHRYGTMISSDIEMTFFRTSTLIPATVEINERIEKARDVIDHEKNFHIQLSVWYENLTIRSYGIVKLLLDTDTIT